MNDAWMGGRTLDLRGDGVNIRLIQRCTAIRDTVLSRGGLGGTVAVRKVINDSLDELAATCGGGGGKIGSEGGDFGR